jgi:hypothetical protein
VPAAWVDSEVREAERMEQYQHDLIVGGKGHGIGDTIWGLTLLAHEKHGGHFQDFDDCTASWCVRGRRALRAYRALLDTMPSAAEPTIDTDPVGPDGNA